MPLERRECPPARTIMLIFSRSSSRSPESRDVQHTIRPVMASEATGEKSGHSFRLMLVVWWGEWSAHPILQQTRLGQRTHHVALNNVAHSRWSEDSWDFCFGGGG